MIFAGKLLNCMSRPKSIPLHTLDGSPGPGIHIKRLTASNSHTLRHYGHRDNYYLLVLMTRGRATLAVDFEERAIEAGEAMVVTPFQVHYPVSATEDAELWLLAMSPEYFTPQETELVARYSLHSGAVRLAGHDDVHDLGNLCDMLIRRLCSSRVAISLASTVKDIILDSITGGMDAGLSRYMSIACRFKALLQLHLPKEKSPSHYASMMAVSEVYLNEAVRAVTGMSVSSFIRNAVVVSAKRYLIYTSMSILEIALALGYEDCAYFSRLFKKETGMSPLHYRKNLE